jgi:hypothetical protein
VVSDDEEEEAEVVDDEQRHGRDGGEVVLAGAGELGLDQLLQQRMRLAVEDTVALLDHGEADGLSQVALAGAGRAEEEGIGVLGDPASGGALEDEGAVHFPVEVEIEGVQALADIAKARLLHPALQEPILPAEQFVLHEAGEQIDRHQLLGLGFEQARLKPGGDAGAAELAEGALPFEDVLGVTSWVFRAMTWG